MYRLLARYWFLAFGLVLSIQAVSESDAQTSSAASLSAHPWAKDTPWVEWLSWAEEKIAACHSTKSNLAPRDCARFAGEALTQVYRAQSFAAQGTRPSNNTIARTVRDARSGWTRLGTAADQSALEAAQREANRGRAVIATMPAGGQDHVAIILPGALQYSSTWRLKVPRTAITFMGNPKRSFFGKPISFGFSLAKGRDLELYARPVATLAQGDSQRRGQAMPHGGRTPAATVKAGTQPAVGGIAAHTKDGGTQAAGEPAPSADASAASAKSVTPPATPTTKQPAASAGPSTTAKTYDVTQILARLSAVPSPTSADQDTADDTAADKPTQDTAGETKTGTTAPDAASESITEEPPASSASTAAVTPQQTRSTEAPATDTDEPAADEAKYGWMPRVETETSATPKPTASGPAQADASAAPTTSGPRNVGDAAAATEQQAARPEAPGVGTTSSGGGNREAYRSPRAQLKRTATPAAAQRKKPGMIRRNKIADNLALVDPLAGRSPQSGATKGATTGTAADDTTERAVSPAAVNETNEDESSDTTTDEASPVATSESTNAQTAATTVADAKASAADTSKAAENSGTQTAPTNVESAAEIAMWAATARPPADTADESPDETASPEEPRALEAEDSDQTGTPETPVAALAAAEAVTDSSSNDDTETSTEDIRSTATDTEEPADGLDAIDYGADAATITAAVPGLGAAPEDGPLAQGDADAEPEAAFEATTVPEPTPAVTIEIPAADNGADETAAETALTLDALTRASQAPSAQPSDLAAATTAPDGNATDTTASGAAPTDPKAEQLANIDPNAPVDARLSGAWCDQAKIAGTNQVWAVLIDSDDKTLSWGVVETDNPDTFKVLASRSILKLTQQGRLVGITFSKSDASAGGLTAYFIFDGSDTLLETHVFDHASNEIFEKGALWERCL